MKLLLCILVSSALFALEPYNYYPYRDLEIKKASRLRILDQEIDQWIAFGQTTFKRPEEKLRFFAYLFTAFRDFIFLSEKTSGSVSGSLSLVGYEMADLMKKTPKLPLIKEPLSLSIMEKIKPKYVSRFEIEEKLGVYNRWHYFSYFFHNLILKNLGHYVEKWIPWSLPYTPVKVNPKLEKLSLQQMVEKLTQGLSIPEKATTLSLFFTLTYNEMIAIGDDLTPFYKSYSKTHSKDSQAFIQFLFDQAYAKAFTLLQEQKNRSL